jgi:two-component system, NtrC family, response regulator AtoC
LNCSQLDTQLGRSELFGVEKGAYTDAKTSRVGLVGEAENGTLFLDELAELALEPQAELLRFIDDRQYRAVGTSTLSSSTALLVAATNANLDKAVMQGKFRRDLLARFRSEMEPILLPPLRQRREDILFWFKKFIAEIKPIEESKIDLSAGVAEILLIHGWQENLRELRRIAGSVCGEWNGEEQIETRHLPEQLVLVRTRARNEDAPALPAAAEERKDPTREQISAALSDSKGNMRKASMTLGIDRRKLYRLCEQLEIDPTDHRG